MKIDTIHTDAWKPYIVADLAPSDTDDYIVHSASSLDVRRTRLSTVSDRAFPVAAAHLSFIDVFLTPAK